MSGYVVLFGATLSADALSILQDLAFWLRFNAIVIPVVVAPIIGMTFSMWYMVKRLYELHTTEVKRSGFGTVGLLEVCHQLKTTSNAQLYQCRECNLMHKKILDILSKVKYES